MKVPNFYYLTCPVCGEETKHKILKGEVGDTGEEITIDGVVECTKCGNTRHKVIREKNAIDVPIVVSWKEESDKDNVSLYPDEWVHKGDEFLLDGEKVKVTSLQLEGNKRKDSSKVEYIRTIWAKKHEEVLVKVAIHKGRNTISKTLEVPPEEEFFIGDRLEAGKHNTVIRRMKTEDDVVKKGKAVAENIKRIYTEPIR